MSTRQALAFSFVDRYAGLIVHTGAAMVIARLLTPAEIGVYSVVMVLLGFVAVFRDFGAGQYLVQHREASVDVMRATFTVQFGLGVTFAAGVVAAASSVASFYGDPRMVAIMYVLAMNFFVTPFLAFPNALLVREMRFRALALIRFSGSVSHVAVAIGLAFGGYGPISLAYANLASTTFAIGVTALLTRLPVWQAPTTRKVREVFGFGGSLTFASLLGNVQSGAPELLLGKLKDLTEAGLMSRALGLTTMFQQLVLSAVGTVALPYFAREARAGNHLGKPFIHAGELIVGLGWAFFGTVGLLAFPITRLLYGAQWDAAVPPLRWLTLAFAVALPGAVCYSPLVALGALGDVVRASALNMAVSALAALAGAFHGVTAVAELQIPANLLASAYWLWLARRRIDFSWRALAASAGRSALVAGATMAVPLGVVLLFGWRPPFHPLLSLACLPVAGAAGVLVARASRHSLWREIENALPSIGRRLHGHT